MRKTIAELYELVIEFEKQINFFDKEMELFSGNQQNISA